MQETSNSKIKMRNMKKEHSKDRWITSLFPNSYEHMKASNKNKLFDYVTQVI